MPATVYISSTYRDLKKHRAAVLKFFDDFNQFFTVNSMEKYKSDDVRPVDECLKDVRNCSFYVLIIANRYGFIPDMVEGTSNTTGLSVTELEYNAAAKNGAKVFVFLAKENAASFESDDDADTSLREQKKKKLDAFRQKVMNEHLIHPDRFISSKDLVLQVQESFFKAKDKYPELFTTGSTALDIKINEDRIYCCNRQTQFDEYLAVNSKSCFKTWVIMGQEEDMVESFTKRISKLTLDIEKPHSYTLNTLFGSGNSYEASKSVFLNAMYKKIFDKLSDEEAVTIEKFVTDVSNYIVTDSATNEKQPVRLAFIISCDTLPAQKDIRFNYLQQLLHDFYEACNKQKCSSIHFFINIEFSEDNESEFKKVIDAIKKSSDGNSYFFPLTRLNKAEKKDIEYWIETYLTDVPFKITRIKNTFFKDLPAEFQMIEAEEDLYQFIKKVNSKDAAVLAILS